MRAKKRRGPAELDPTPSPPETATPPLAPPWEPGLGGAPKGAPPARGLGPTRGSIVNWMKRRLRDRPLNAAGKRYRYDDLADELADVMLKAAKRGKFNFLKEVIEKTESRQLTEAELQDEIDRVHRIVERHVLKLQGGKIAMAAIAAELQRR